MGMLGFGKKKDVVRMKSARLQDVLTKGMGRDYIPESEKKAIFNALAKEKGASLAQSYLSGEKNIANLNEAMKILEKAGVLKQYQGTGLLEHFKNQWETRQRNIKMTIKSDIQKEMAKQVLSGGTGQLSDIQKRMYSRQLSPKEIQDIERKQKAMARVNALVSKNKTKPGVQKSPGTRPFSGGSPIRLAR